MQRSMKKLRGFRLGRRLVRIWRWVFQRRRPKNYIRLNPTQSQPLIRPKALTMTTKLFDWGRDLTSRIRSSGRGGGGKAHCRSLGGWEADGDDAGHQKGGGRRKPPPPPPKGHLVVYVGGQKDGGPPKRYLVPLIHFNHPLFAELLREAEEEFGYHHPGGITIPCPVSYFERVQTRIAACRRTSQPNRFYIKRL